MRGRRQTFWFKLIAHREKIRVQTRMDAERMAAADVEHGSDGGGRKNGKRSKRMGKEAKLGWERRHLVLNRPSMHAA